MHFVCVPVLAVQGVQTVTAEHPELEGQGLETETGARGGEGTTKVTQARTVRGSVATMHIRGHSRSEIHATYQLWNCDNKAYPPKIHPRTLPPVAPSTRGRPGASTVKNQKIIPGGNAEKHLQWHIIPIKKKHALQKKKIQYSKFALICLKQHQATVG